MHEHSHSNFLAQVGGLYLDYASLGSKSARGIRISRTRS